MGQKVNPISFRLNIGNRSWDSIWYQSSNAGFASNIYSDYCIRRAAMKVFSNTSVSRVVIKRDLDSLQIVLYSSKPGLIVGKNGLYIDNFKDAVSKITSIKQDKIVVDVFELKKPDTNAALVARNIAFQIEKRSSFRRVIKLAMHNAMSSGAKGIKVSCSGRINGADIARSEFFKSGSIPLHRLRADVDYAVSEANTSYGVVGIKVWVYRGDFVKDFVE